MEPNDEKEKGEEDQVGASTTHGDPTTTTTIHRNRNDDYDEEEEGEGEEDMKIKMMMMRQGLGQGRVSRIGLNDVAEPIMDASFQDDFDDIHSDYQWFIESGFATDGHGLDATGDFPTPLCIGVGVGTDFEFDIAHIDMEDFQSQDILLRFPPLCASDLQPNQGETIASITGSILQQFDFESSMSPNSHSVEDEQNQSMDMSICKSENLFSPINEQQQQLQLPLSTFSTDSLDARGETMLATCMTNRNNYTIAFQGVELDDSTTTSTYRTACDTTHNLISPASDMTENEMTNWRQLKSSNDNGNTNTNTNNYSNYSGHKHGHSKNNNGSSETSSNSNSNYGQNGQLDESSICNDMTTNDYSDAGQNPSLLTQSCPNPWYWKKNSLVFNNNNPKIQTAAFVKLFDIHHSRPSSIGKDSSMTESNVHMASGSGSGSGGSRLDGGMGIGSSGSGTGSTGTGSRAHSNIMEESWNNNRNPNPNPFRIRTKFEKSKPTTTTQLAEAVKKSRSIQIQTSSIKLKPKRLQDFPPKKMTKTSPVFVCFPSYTLPDLNFLSHNLKDDQENDLDLPEVYLLPQQYKPISNRNHNSRMTQDSSQIHNNTNTNNNNHHRHSLATASNANANAGTGTGGRGGRGRRPMSCNDIEDLRKRDLSHVRDWPSLNFLLPQEYQSILEVMKPLEKREQNDETEKEKDASVPPEQEQQQQEQQENQNQTQIQHQQGAQAPTTLLLQENNEPVILRRKPGHPRTGGGTKRFSLNDSSSSPGRSRCFAEKFKRFSLQETLPEVSEITTEIAKNLEQLESLASHLGSDFGFTNGNQNQHQHQHSNPHPHNHHHHQQQHYQHQHHQYNHNHDHESNIIPLEQTDSADSSGCSSHHHRRVPNNTPKQNSYVDFDNHFKTLEEGAAKIVAHVAPMCSLNNSQHHPKHIRTHIDMAEKQSLTDAVAAAVTQIQSSWTPASATDNRHANIPGGRNNFKYPNLVIMSETPAGKMALETLCPALYSLLSDGLCPYLETIFGRVPNTVWRVVEASIQYGPTAQTLNELVLRINSEEILAEGPMKLNAFVCGLLNLGNLGSWLTFLRTKERLLRTHYDPEAFMFLCNTSTRFLYDQMLVNMHLLAKLPFQLDIFHETKLLHQSMNPSSFVSTKSNPALPQMRKTSSKNGGGGGRPATAVNVRKSTSADARLPKLQSHSKNSKYYANQLKKSQMKRSFSDERPKTAQKPSTLPKSKTAQNIQNERQYSHSGVPRPTSYGSSVLLARFPSKPKISSISAETADQREKGMEPTKAQRPKSIGGGGDGGDGLSEGGNKDPDRFRRLQMQWELLSSDEARKTTSPGSGPSTTTTSKIPRPITSPNRNYHPGLPGSPQTANVRPTSKR